MRYCNPMRLGALVPTIVLMACVASAHTSRPGSRGQSGRPAPPPPSPPAAPQQPIVTPPFVTPQAQPPFVPTPSSQTRSPFDATSRTYAPRYDSRPRRRYGPPYYSSAVGIGELATGSPSVAVPDDVPSAFAGPPLTTPVFERPVVVASRGPDTYYVIPGCYAGNRPPNPQRLPKGCDAKNVKTTPVR